MRPSPVISNLFRLLAELLLRFFVLVLNLKGSSSRIEVLLAQRRYLGALPFDNGILIFHSLLEFLEPSSQTSHFVVSTESCRIIDYLFRALTRGTWYALTLVLVEDAGTAVENGRRLCGGFRNACSCAAAEALHSQRRARSGSVSTDAAVLLGAGATCTTSLLAYESLSRLHCDRVYSGILRIYVLVSTSAYLKLFRNQK